MLSILNVNGDVGGVTFNSTVRRESESIIGSDPPLPTAVAGTLTTRTDNDTGVVTVTANSGITTGQKVDVYWDGGRRYNVTVGTVSGAGGITVPIDVGSGDNLPLAQTAVTVSPRTTIACPFNADLLIMLAIVCVVIGRIEFYVDTSMELGIDLVAGEPYCWWSDLAVNPLAGHAVTSIVCSQSSVAATVKMKFGGQVDSVV